MIREIKFKVGDRVVYVKNSDFIKEYGMPYGSIGTILEEDAVPYVRMDDESYNDTRNSKFVSKFRILDQEELVLLSEYSSPKSEEPLKMPLTARFTGTDSLGYKHNVKYALLFSVNEVGGITIERFHKGCDIDGLCHYDSFRSFLQNWETSF